jgi:dihydropyrimidinase
MEIAARNESLVMVHAENGDAIDILIQEALARGNTSPKYHAQTRPTELEGEATNRAIQLARVAGCALYVVHVSCTDAIEPIARAREAGWNVWGETCPQYLSIDYSYLDQPGFEGAKYVYTPPPRDERHRDALWHALATDVLSVVATDHAPFRFRDQKALGKHDFTKIPNGAPGIEERLQILYTYGVEAGRFDLNRMVMLWATKPAKLFGLYPRKGTVAVGSDADLVVFDPEATSTLTLENQHSTCDYNLYEGLRVTGAATVVLVRGTVVVEGSQLVAEPGHGRFTARAPFNRPLMPSLPPREPVTANG